MQISLDPFSHQARLSNDERFFLRRLQEPPNRLTDLNFGDVPQDQQPAVLHHFMVSTGGWPEACVEFDAIGYDDDSADVLAQNEKRISSLIQDAIPWAGIRTAEREIIWRRVLLRLHFE